MRDLLATTKNEQAVWYDPVTSHAATHFSSEPGLQQSVKAVISNLDLTEDSVYTEINFDHPVGMTDLATTDETDEIIYAKRIGRDIYTRFTKSRSQLSTKTLTLWLVRLEENSYDLKSAWFGPKVPSFPGNEWETPESKPFWANHALVWGHQAVVEDTITSECPW